MQVAIPLSFELKLKAPSTEEVMAAIQKCLDPRFVATDPVAVPTSTTPPAIDEVWPGQGGIYAGVARGRDGEPDYHLILCQEAPKKDFTWQAALDFAKSIEADGHKDFAVPSRWESALLYANLQDQFETDRWHWTSTQYSGPRLRSGLQRRQPGRRRQGLRAPGPVRPQINSLIS